MDPDELLVRRAQRGDRFAFEALVERHQGRLFTLAARVLGSRQDAEDAVQDALVRAWLALPRFRGDARFSTWLYRICLNAAHDVRGRARIQVAEEVVEAADPRDRFAEHELSGDLQRALNALHEDFRDAVVLADVLGCTYAEVAELTGVPEGTVKSRVFRGRSELARLLGTTVERTESNQ
jgi:RNA polymerase sigma-70 factor (ECF subfamily)